MRILVLASLLAVSACSDDVEPIPTPEPTVLTDDGVVDNATAEPGPIEVGDWSMYSEPDDATEWPTADLREDRWARVTAELACAGRAHHGDPSAHEAASRRILAHHQTTAADVMAFGVEVNADAARAHRLGERIARATETCR